MKTSTQGLYLLTEREDRRNAAYLDTKGIPTIGVGHTGPEVHLGLVWSEGEIEAALAKDLSRFEAAVNGVPHALEQHQFDALVSFAFNVGVGAFTSSTLRKYLALGNMEAAANELDKWHIPPEVTSRRNGEREQFKGTAFEARIA